MLTNWCLLTDSVRLSQGPTIFYQKTFRAPSPKSKCQTLTENTYDSLEI